MQSYEVEEGEEAALLAAPAKLSPNGLFRRLFPSAAIKIIAILSCAYVVFWVLIILYDPGIPPPVIFDLSTAPVAIRDLYARQSQTLGQARARYTLVTSLEPPPRYEAFYTFSKTHQCLIDDYGLVHQSFRPFYQLEQTRPGHFRHMVQLQHDKKVVKTAIVKKGHVWFWTSLLGHFYDRAWVRDWLRIWRTFAVYLPDMKFTINLRDEPRVVFDYHRPDAFKLALNETDHTPFAHRPRPAAPFFEKRCLLPNNPNSGFDISTNPNNAFLLEPFSTDFTTALFPILSQSSISCFGDIIFPSPYHYQASKIVPPFAYPDRVPWTQKIPKLYWRGTTSGGNITSSSPSSPYHHFPRFRLLRIAANHSDLVDARATSLSNCQKKWGCEKEDILKVYGEGGLGLLSEGGKDEREKSYEFKFVLDLDGNAWSGRFLDLMRTGSLVFKSTIFEEFFSDWLEPYVHYIPVLPDLSDLLDRVRWAIEHEDEARRIAEAGRAMTHYVLTDAQADCYSFAVLLEWARLYNGLV